MFHKAGDILFARTLISRLESPCLVFDTMVQAQSNEWQPPAGLLPKTFMHGYATGKLAILRFR